MMARKHGGRSRQEFVILHPGSSQEMECSLAIKPLDLPSWCSPSLMLYFLRIPQASQTASPDEDQMFKHMSPWKTIHVQITTLTMFQILEKKNQLLAVQQSIRMVFKQRSLCRCSSILYVVHWEFFSIGNIELCQMILIPLRSSHAFWPWL